MPRPYGQAQALFEVVAPQPVDLHLVVEGPTVEAGVLGHAADVALEAAQDAAQVLPLDGLGHPAHDGLEGLVRVEGRDDAPFPN